MPLGVPEAFRVWRMWPSGLPVMVFNWFCLARSEMGFFLQDDIWVFMGRYRDIVRLWEC